MTSEERKTKASEILAVLLANSRFFLGSVKLKDGGLVKIYHSTYVGCYTVDFYCVKGRTQSIIGSLYVKLSDFAVDGVFYDYTKNGQHAHRVSMTSNTPQDAIDKMASCVAPLMEVDTWPEPNQSMPLSLVGDCRE